MANEQQIHFSCENCGREIHVSASAAGRMGKCKTCNAEVLVPSLSKTRAAPAAAAVLEIQSEKHSEDPPSPASAEPHRDRLKPIRYTIWILCAVVFTVLGWNYGGIGGAIAGALVGALVGVLLAETCISVIEGLIDVVPRIIEFTVGVFIVVAVGFAIWKFWGVGK